MAFAWIIPILLVWYRVEKWLEKELGMAQMRLLFIAITPFFILFLCQIYASQESGIMMVKNGLFICLLFLIGCFDYYTCTIPRFTHYLIVFTALIGLDESIVERVVAVLFLITPFLMVYLIAFFSKKKSWSFGLGDLLFIASGTFFLGAIPGMFGISVGFILFLVWGAVKRTEQLPLAPALSIGYMLGLILMQKGF